MPEAHGRQAPTLATSLTRALLRAWPFVLAAALVGGLLGAAAAQTRPPAYEATARLVLTEPAEVGSLGLAASDDPARRMQTQLERLREDDLLARAADHAGVALSADEVRDRLDATVSDVSDVLELTVVDGAADRAVALADGVALAVEEAVRADITDRADAVRAELVTLQDAYQAQIDEVDAALAAGADDATAAQLQARRDLAISELNQAAVDAERVRVDASLAASSAVERQPADPPTGPSTPGAMLGGLIGLVLAATAAALLAWWHAERDPLVARDGDPEQLLGTPRLATVSAAAPVPMTSGSVQPGAREAIDALSFRPGFEQVTRLLCAPAGAERTGSEASLQLALALAEDGTRMALCNVDASDTHLTERLRPDLVSPGSGRRRVEDRPGTVHTVRISGTELAFVSLACPATGSDRAARIGRVLDDLVAQGYRVVVNGPKVTSGRDAAVVSRLVDAAVLLVAPRTPVAELIAAHHRLESAGRPLLGYLWLADVSYARRRSPALWTVGAVPARRELDRV